MTDNEIIKALECCGNEGWSSCHPCPYRENRFERHCAFELSHDALNLINRQKAEIEKLKALAQNGASAIDTNNRLVQKFAEIKSEAYKEFAERLKSLVNQHHYMLANIHNSRDFGMFTVGFEQAIDNLVKEMVGENNAE